MSRPLEASSILTASSSLTEMLSMQSHSLSREGVGHN